MSGALTALRPADQSQGAIQSALAALSQQRSTAILRLAERRVARSKALLDPSVGTKQVAAIEAEIRDGEIMLERLTAIRPSLESALTDARATEQRAEINRRADLAAAAVNEFTQALDEYPQLATGIARICALNRAALVAIIEAQRAAAAVGERPVFPLHGPNGGQLADAVALPRLSGGMIWGTAAPPAPMYSPVAVVV